MKLRLITEARSRTAISDGSEAIGDLIEFIRDTGTPEEQKTLNLFLQAPSTKTWLNSKWLIDSASKRAINDRSLADRIKLWNTLKGLTPLVVVASVYGIDPKQAKDTPFQRVALSSPIRDKAKRALGPQGYVRTMAHASAMPKNKLRDMLKAAAKDNIAVTKSIRHDLPGVKPVTSF